MGGRGSGAATATGRPSEAPEAAAATFDAYELYTEEASDAAAEEASEASAANAMPPQPLTPAYVQEQFGHGRVTEQQAMMMSSRTCTLEGPLQQTFLLINML